MGKKIAEVNPPIMIKITKLGAIKYIKKARKGRKPKYQRMMLFRNFKFERSMNRISIR